MDNESVNSDSSETVYVTQDEHHVMSEKVQALAATVYQEFERMIKKYDEDVVKELMPLVVGILESMDITCSDKQESEVELELLRDDNEQLLTQYEREKQLRRASEQKYLEIEDSIESEKKEMISKIESLESIVRMLELKSRNSSDHVSRLEEKESEMKKEYTKLHDRYTELFKSHMDYMERAKLVLGSDRIGDLAHSPRSSGKAGMNLPIVKPINLIMGAGDTPTTFGETGPLGYDASTPDAANISNRSLRSELEVRDASIEKLDKGQVTDSVDKRETSTGMSVKRKSQPATITNPQEATTVIDQSVIPLQILANSQPPVDSGTVPIVVNKTDDNSQNDRNSQTFSNDKVNNILLQPISDSVNDKSVVSLNPVVIETGSVEKVKAPNGELHRARSNPTGSIKNIDIFGQSLGFPLESSIKLDRASTPNVENQPSFPPSSRNNESLFDELNSDVTGDAFFGSDVTGNEVHPGDYASSDDEDDNKEKDIYANDNFFGMGKEVENLILENTELLATKNALNIVKDDLIAKVDDLMSEQEILREDVQSLQVVKTRLNQRISQLEEELKKAREELEKKAQSVQAEEEQDDVPMAQRKRFTRVEMARVLMERNQYKERLMELQEAVRWTEMIRASREHPELVPKKKTSIWGLFSSLVVAPSEEEPQPPRKKNLAAAQIV